MTCTGSAIVPVNIFGPQAFCLVNQCLASDPQPPRTFGAGGSMSTYDIYRPQYGQILRRKKRQQDWFYNQDSNDNPGNEEPFDEPAKEDVIDDGDAMAINLEEQKVTNNDNNNEDVNNEQEEPQFLFDINEKDDVLF